jgi:parvulin-like peptidyl-prolyl isomerase
MKNYFHALLISVSAAAVLSGCTNTPPTASNTTGADGTTTGAVGNVGTPDLTTKDGSGAVVPGIPTPGAAPELPSGQSGVITKTLPDGQKQVSINMSDLPNETVICTVGSTPVKVSTYKSMLTMKQVQLSTGIGQDPAVRAQLLAEAQKRGLTLSKDEKGRLIRTAKASQAKDKGGFEQFLKEKGLNESQYEQEILNIGLAYKMSSLLLQQELMPELVRRELLCNAAKTGGLEKDAMNKYFLFKHSRSYPVMAQQTGLPHDALKDEIVKTELAKLQVKKLTKNLQVSEAEVKGTYDKNKDLFKHGERIKLASILILAPTTDLPPEITSIKTEVKRQNPNLSDAEVDARVTIVNKQLEQRALVVLGKAQQNPKDFAKIANDNTDDMQAKMRSTGGDLGWLDKPALTPTVADAVWDLKAGTVLPRLITTEVGYQIIKVVGRKKPGYLSYKEVKPVVAMQVQQIKTQDMLNNWLAAKQKSTKIEFSPKFLALSAGCGDNKAK